MLDLFCDPSCPRDLQPSGKPTAENMWICLFYFRSLGTIYYQVWLNQYRWSVPNNCFHLHIFITGKIKNFCIYWFELQDMWMNICINIYMCGVAIDLSISFTIHAHPCRRDQISDLSFGFSYRTQTYLRLLTKNRDGENGRILPFLINHTVFFRESVIVWNTIEINGVSSNP